MYALTYKLLGILRIGDFPLFSYDEFIQEQDVPEHKTTIIGSCIRTWDTTGVISSNQIRKSPTGCWAFFMSF